jgi:predicted ATP-grasp superfamily ATP-dependent carboligase
VKVLLACASDWASPARLPRVLHQAGVEVHAFSARERALARTRFVDVLHPAPEAFHEYVEALRAHLEGNRYSWVLVCDDPLLAALSARRGEAWLDGILPISGEWAPVLASKADFCALGEAAGLPIPPTRICHTLDDAVAAAAELGLPLILKESAGFAGLGVRLVEAPEALAPAWQALQERPATVVAQHFVPGPIGNTVVLFSHGVPLCWMSAYKVRTWPGPFGPSSARRFMTHPEVAPLLRKVGALTGYHGFGALDWVHAGDRLHLIELNARPVPTIHMGALAGVDFPRAIRCFLNGKQELQEPPEPSGDAPIHPMFPEDLLRAASEGRVALPIGDMPWTDPPLLIHHLRRLLAARS